MAAKPPSTLPAGTHQLSLKPASSFSTGGLLDPRELTLVPSPPQPPTPRPTPPTPAHSPSP